MSERQPKIVDSVNGFVFWLACDLGIDESLRETRSERLMTGGLNVADSIFTAHWIETFSPHPLRLTPPAQESSGWDDLAE
jgi:hypothetical protein